MSIAAVTKNEPTVVIQPGARTPLSNHVAYIREKVGTRQGWLGDYDYVWLCTPSLPFMRGKRTSPPFYPLNSDLPLLVAISCGFQHSLAMLAGLIAPPIVFASALNLDAQLSSYMVSASLITTGFLSLVQLSRTRLFRNYYLGTGMLSVVGTSFSTLSTANSIFNTMYNNGTCKTITDQNGVVTRLACPDAFGYLLGTSLICAFLEMGLSLIPPRSLQRIFPPIVTGSVILMIGSSLVGASGILNWGGGSNGCQTRPASGSFRLCPNINSPRALPWGSPQFIGLGFLSFIAIPLTELFGSPFLKNISIIVGLAIGCIVAGAAGYIDGSSIKSAPVITFLWVHTFKIRVYPPAILPMLAVYIALTMEAIGDITASAEVSRLEVEGEEFDSRIQGGILADGIGGFLSALCTVTPVSVFAQNNGVISITRCANRSAGRWCCFFLILYGVLGKIAGVFLAIPNPVLGGVTTFLFASVATSGARVLAYSEFTRRDRFVIGSALSFGIGILLVPTIFTHLFDGVRNPNKGLAGFIAAIEIILSTPFLTTGIVASALNLILPRDAGDEEDDDGRVHQVSEEIEFATGDRK